MHPSGKMKKHPDQPAGKHMSTGEAGRDEKLRADFHHQQGRQRTPKQNRRAMARGWEVVPTELLVKGDPFCNTVPITNTGAWHLGNW